MLGHTEIIECVAFLPDGKHAVSGAGDATIRVWDLNKGEEVGKFSGLRRQALWISVTRDGKYLLSGDYNGHEVRMWELPTRKLLQTIPWGSASPTRGCFSPNGKSAVWPGSDGVVRLFRSADYESPETASSNPGTIEGKPRLRGGKHSKTGKRR
jgi:WD40 repeat protein